MTSAHYHPFRLAPWLVRALITQQHAGTYVLYRQGKPVYAGRSDQDVGKRLVTHAYRGTADYFGFSLHPDAERAYDMECALFHSLRDTTSNRIHPGSPKGSRRRCFICAHGDERDVLFESLQRNRPHAPNTHVTREIARTFLTAETDQLTASVNWRKP